MKTIVTIILLTVSFLFGITQPWPQAYHDAQRTGRSIYLGPQKNPIEMWSVTCRLDFCIDSNGNHYSGFPSDYTRCIDKNGHEVWRNTDANYSTSILLTSDGSRVWVSYYNEYYENRFGYLYILDASNGAKIKKWNSFASYNLTEDSEGNVYSWRDSLYKWDKDGNLIWGKDIGTSKLAISPSGNLIFNGSSILAAYDKDGNFLWQKDGNSINIKYYSCPSIGVDNTIYLTGTNTGTNRGMGLVAFNPDGTEKWTYGYAIGATGDEPAAIGADGTIYAGATYQRPSIIAFYPSGDIKWKIDYAGYGVVIVDASGTIYSRGYKGGKEGLYAINPDGSEKWFYSIDWGFTQTKIAIGIDKMLYYLNEETNYLYAIGEGTGFKDKRASAALPSKTLTAFPNPFTTHLSLFIPSPASIYSLTGQLIKTLPKGKHEVDTSSWRNGVYIIRCGKETKRVVKIN